MSGLIAKFFFMKCQCRTGYPPQAWLAIVPAPQSVGIEQGCLQMSESKVVVRRRFKFAARATPYVFAFFMASIMAMLMSLVITAVNAGIDPQFPSRVLSAYQLAMPTAFCCVLLVRPLVMRLVALTVHPAA